MQSETQLETQRNLDFDFKLIPFPQGPLSAGSCFSGLGDGSY